MNSLVSHFLIFDRLGDWIIFIFNNVFIRPKIYLMVGAFLFVSCNCIHFIVRMKLELMTEKFKHIKKYIKGEYKEAYTKAY